MSGLMRTYLKCYQSLIDNVIIPNKADLFISTWSILGTGTYKVPVSPWVSAGEEFDLNVDEVHKTYQDHLKILNVDDWKSFQKRFSDELDESCKRSPSHVYHDPRNNSITRRLVSMWYKVSDANNLRKQYEKENNTKYDVVIRARPDLMHKSVLLMSNYNLVSPNIFVDARHSYGYVCDQFAFGRPKVMDAYSSVYPAILSYNNIMAVYVAEMMMEAHLRENNLAVNFMDMNYVIDKSLGEK